jgi:hypothetical protein
MRYRLSAAQGINPMPHNDARIIQQDIDHLPFL